MKLSQSFLFLVIGVLLLQLSCKKGTEPEETSQGPIVGIYPFESISSFPDSIRALQDFTQIYIAFFYPIIVLSRLPLPMLGCREAF